VDEVLPNPTQPNLPVRFTPHYFLPDSASAIDRARVAQYRQDFRHPDELQDAWPKEWPPAFLWDFIYGVAIAKAYGNKDAVTLLNDKASPQYYPEGIQRATERARTDIQRRQQERDQRRKDQREARDERARRRGGAQDQMDLSDATDMVFCLWMESRFGPRGQKARVEEMAERTRRVQERQRLTAERVDTWRGSVEDSAA